MTAGMIILVILCVLLLLVVMILVKVVENKEESHKAYQNLLAFRYYVNNCALNETSIATIDDRLKLERARPEMEDVIYSDLVWDINLDYCKRIDSYNRRKRADKINGRYEEAKTTD